MTPPVVHLVGAGPGDVRLLTRRAADLLARADVVVLDRPSLDPIASLAEGAERIHVGRLPGQRAWSTTATVAPARRAGARRAARRPAEGWRPVRLLTGRRGGPRAPGRGRRRGRHTGRHRGHRSPARRRHSHRTGGHRGRRQPRRGVTAGRLDDARCDRRRRGRADRPVPPGRHRRRPDRGWTPRRCPGGARPRRHPGRRAHRVRLPSARSPASGSTRRPTLVVAPVPSMRGDDRAHP